MRRPPDGVDGVAMYALLAPGSRTVRYVGSTKTPRKRLASHMREGGHTEKCRWIADMRRRGEVPIMRILEVVSEGFGRRVRERAWIVRFARTVVNDRSNPLRKKPTPALGVKIVAARLTHEDLARLDAFGKKMGKQYGLRAGRAGLVAVLVRRGLEVEEKKVLSTD